MRYNTEIQALTILAGKLMERDLDLAIAKRDDESFLLTTGDHEIRYDTDIGAFIVIGGPEVISAQELVELILGFPND